MVHCRSFEHRGLFNYIYIHIIILTDSKPKSILCPDCVLRINVGKVHSWPDCTSTITILSLLDIYASYTVMCLLYRNQYYYHTP